MGKRALDCTLGPSLNGNRLIVSSRKRECRAKQSLLLAMSYKDDSCEILRTAGALGDDGFKQTGHI